ncbi:hypothetical protein [Mycolicibacterium helvum]|uniref:hypothetical protein n=1 Tax=Mycolicibacterium helvum TaxID=1534349 RepID=UPI001FECCF0A|nr:hypothetical protein [Mycolicibacterium helvum]
MATSQPPERIAAERWFLTRGLSSVLTNRARWRRLWPRSAPALSAFATVMVSTVLVKLAGATTYQQTDDDNPSAAQWVLIAIVAGVIPVALLVGKTVGRITEDRRRAAAAVAAIVVALVCDVFNGPTSHPLADVGSTIFAVITLLGLNGLGIGAVLGWAGRLTGEHLASVGGLFARALPVVLLTVLVFFNGPVWSMAATITRERLLAVALFMTSIAVIFLYTGIVERIQPLLGSTTLREGDQQQLVGTPFETMPDPPSGFPLRTLERINVIFVVVASAVAQIASVALVTMMIFLIMGLLALTPDLMADWTHHGPETSAWLGITIPIPPALLHVTMFLGALTFMYISALSVNDKRYRTQFLDPLFDKLRLTLVARNRYRQYIAAGAR